MSGAAKVALNGCIEPGLVVPLPLVGTVFRTIMSVVFPPQNSAPQHSRSSTHKVPIVSVISGESKLLQPLPLVNSCPLTHDDEDKPDGGSSGKEDEDDVLADIPLSSEQLPVR